MDEATNTTTTAPEPPPIERYRKGHTPEASASPGDLDAMLKWSANSGGDIEVKHWAVKLLAANLANTLKTFGAENYVTCEMTHPDTGPLVVTVQRKCGKSPSDVIRELEDLLRGVVVEAEEWFMDDEPAFERASKYLAERRKINAHGQRLDEPKRWSWWRRALMRLALVRWR